MYVNFSKPGRIKPYLRIIVKKKFGDINIAACKNYITVFYIPAYKIIYAFSARNKRNNV